MSLGQWIDLMWTTGLRMLTPELGLIQGGLTVLAMVLILGLNHFTVRRGFAQAALYAIMVIGWYGLAVYVLGGEALTGAALKMTVFTFQLTVNIVIANILAAIIVWLAPGPTIRIRRGIAGWLRGVASRMEEDAAKTVHEKRAEVMEIASIVLAKKNGGSDA